MEHYKWKMIYYRLSLSGLKLFLQQDLPLLIANDFTVGFKQVKDVTETDVKKEQLPCWLPLKMVALKTYTVVFTVAP